MSDVINGVPRELLGRSAQMIQFYVEYLCATNSEESDIELSGECVDELRALLTAQPQASAAQSAPAGEREALWQLIHDTLRNYRMSTLVDEDGDGYPLIDALTADSQPVSGGMEECIYLADAIWDAIEAAWQRTQSAGAPDGESLAELLESVRLGDDEAKPHGYGATYWNNAVIACQVAIRDVLTAPAQPAAQELCKVCKGFGRYQDGDSGTDADGRAPNIVDCDCADSERLPQYRAAHDQGEVQRLREALHKIAVQCSCEATTDRLDALLAASTGQGVE